MTLVTEILDDVGGYIVYKEYPRISEYSYYRMSPGKWVLRIHFKRYEVAFFVTWGELRLYNFKDIVLDRLKDVVKSSPL